MPEFDPSRAYRQHNAPGHNSRDGREIELMRFIWQHPRLEHLRGNPEAIIEAMDEFGRERTFLMNVGPFKRESLAALVAEVQPGIMVELGGYMGYSALLFGSICRNNGGLKYISLESDPVFASLASFFVRLAGLEKFVQIIVGDAASSLRMLSSTGVLSKIDLLFIDHEKSRYLGDLKLCEELGLIHEGSLVAADNMIWPGNPLYREYIRKSVSEKSRDLRHCAQRTDSQPKTFDSEPLGNPSILYQVETLMSFEPHGEEDAIDVARCNGGPPSDSGSNPQPTHLSATGSKNDSKSSLFIL